MSKIKTKEVCTLTDLDTQLMNKIVYIHNYQFSDHEGRLLTLIETLGLPKVQEDAIKSMIRREVWGTWDDCFLIPESIKEQLYKSKEVVRVTQEHLPR